MSLAKRIDRQPIYTSSVRDGGVICTLSTYHLKGSCVIFVAPDVSFGVLAVVGGASMRTAEDMSDESSLCSEDSEEVADSSSVCTGVTGPTGVRGP